MPYYKLRVWEKSMELSEQIYELTSSFPRDERFGLVQQLRRASVSVPSNIAEGSQRKTDNEFAHFLYIARGSLIEVETQIILSSRLGYLKQERMQSVRTQIIGIQKMLYALQNKLTAYRQPPTASSVYKQ